MNTFYCENISDEVIRLTLDESKHCIKVLRQKKGDQIYVTDGKGKLVIAELVDENHKGISCKLIEDISPIQSKRHRIHIAIAPTKNIDRMEWFVEKAGELGVDEISFMKTQNSERPTLKLDRLHRKAISALKQSKSGILLQINELTSFDKILARGASCDLKFIAAVKEGLPYFTEVLEADKEVIILIGPEGDFTKEEVEKAVQLNYQPISLGQNVLRTETAGIVAGQFINIANYC